jgi:hypothetical protein
MFYQFKVLENTTVNRAMFALNFYLSTGDYIGEGVALDNYLHPATGKDCTMLMVTYDPLNPEDAGNWDKLHARLKELIAENLVIELKDEDWTPGHRGPQTFRSFLIVVETLRLDEFARAVREKPGPKGWGTSYDYLKRYGLLDAEMPPATAPPQATAEAHVMKVGSLYSPDRTYWEERNEFNISNGMPELRFFFKSPGKAEIEAIQRGEASFALFVEQPVILLCSQFGVPGKPPALPWSDASFSIHLVRAQFPEEAIVPEIPTNDSQRYLLQVVLVDAETGIIKAMRALTFSAPFTRELIEAVREQDAMRWDKVYYEGLLRSIYKRYGTPKDLVADARTRCKGGK